MKRIIHWIAHRLGTNRGFVESWIVGDSVIIGFFCCGCHKIFDAQEVDHMRRAREDAGL